MVCFLSRRESRFFSDISDSSTSLRNQTLFMIFRQSWNDLIKVTLRSLAMATCRAVLSRLPAISTAPQGHSAVSEVSPAPASQCITQPPCTDTPAYCLAMLIVGRSCSVRQCCVICRHLRDISAASHDLSQLLTLFSQVLMWEHFKASLNIEEAASLNGPLSTLSV
eukprot:6066516-Amphidinium_carterae.1